MKQSGFDAMAKEINSNQQNYHLENIDHPQLMEWVWQSGFSFDELALIQPYYGGWGTEFTELHFNNVGTDINEYIEIHDASPGFLGLPFDSVYFYNNSNVLYKTIAKNQMSQMVLDPYFYYYTFPSNENFADEGKVELIYHDNLDNRYIVGSLVYTSSQVTREGMWLPPSTHPISENETTPLGTSLSFCGNAFSGPYLPELIPATIGSIQGCLQNIAPVNIINFTHQLENNQVKLSWEIPDYNSSLQVFLERSIDGNSFHTIATNLNPSTLTKFQHLDANPNYTNHYRVKLVTPSGEVIYSKLIFIKFRTKNPLVIQQQVASNSITVQIKKPLEQVKYLQLYTIQGKLIMQLPIHSSILQFSVRHLAAGKYLVRLGSTDHLTYTASFIKN